LKVWANRSNVARNAAFDWECAIPAVRQIVSGKVNAERSGIAVTVSYLLIHRLVVENLRSRPVRTLVSALAIGVQVTLVLTLVGLSRGMVEDAQQRARGVGADIAIRAPGSSVFSFTGTFSDSALATVRAEPGVTLATGTYVYGIGGLNSVTGINLAEFTRMSGGFHFLEGGALSGPDDIILDQIFADENHKHAGDSIELLNRPWKISGVVEPGLLSRAFVDMAHLQDLTGGNGRISAMYVKLADPSGTEAVEGELKTQLPAFPIYSMQEFISLLTETNVPMLHTFTRVIIAIGMLVGFLVVFLSMYTAVLERTREIGILKALGGSPWFILNCLLRETVLLALVGSVLGIAMTYGARQLIRIFAPQMITVIVPDWWPIAAAISIVGALAGALYPGLRAARHDVVEALAYE
jgi:putative ABC transport system permease protein